MSKFSSSSSLNKILLDESVTKRWDFGVWLLATQKPINRPGWWKGKFALFPMSAPATGEGEGIHLSKGWLPALATSGARAFINRRRGFHAEIAQLSLTVILKLAIDGLTSIILVVLGTVNLQFQDPFFPFFWGQFSELWHLLSWVLSGHHVLNFSTWCFSICKTARRYGSEYYLWPLRKNSVSLTVLKD